MAITTSSSMRLKPADGLRIRRRLVACNPKSEIRNPQLEHVPVLLREAADFLEPRGGGVYVDGTLGAGGHAAEILKRSAPDGIVIGLDRDPEAVERSRVNLAAFGSRAVVRHANYRDLSGVLASLGFEEVDGVLLDLGVSWFHVKTPERGFSFQMDGPLDMRMDTSMPQTAADLVNGLSRDELARIIREYGEERRAGAIARAIDKAKARGPITRTVQLAEIVSSVFPPFPPRRIHPATLTFQALRIAVNDELGALSQFLRLVPYCLHPGGRVGVISFHSGEDRLVKHSFREGVRTGVYRSIARDIIVPAPEEVRSNPRSASAKFRWAVKSLSTSDSGG